MVEIEETQFKTFLAAKDMDLPTLDLQKLMLKIVNTHNFSMRDFWDMPLFIVLELIGMFTSPKLQPISRKMLVEQERRMNIKYGRQITR